MPKWCIDDAPQIHIKAYFGLFHTFECVYFARWTHIKKQHIASKQPYRESNSLSLSLGSSLWFVHFGFATPYECLQPANIQIYVYRCEFNGMGLGVSVQSHFCWCFVVDILVFQSACFLVALWECVLFEQKISFVSDQASSTVLLLHALSGVEQFLLIYWPEPCIVLECWRIDNNVLAVF